MGPLTATNSVKCPFGHVKISFLENRMGPPCLSYVGNEPRIFCLNRFRDRIYPMNLRRQLGYRSDLNSSEVL